MNDILLVLAITSSVFFPIVIIGTFIIWCMIFKCKNKFKSERSTSFEFIQFMDVTERCNQIKNEFSFQKEKFTEK